MLRPAKCETGHKNICTVFKGVRFPVYDLLLCAIIEQLHLRVSKLEFIVATFTNYYGALPVGGVTAGCSTLSVCLSVGLSVCLSSASRLRAKIPERQNLHEKMPMSRVA